MNSRLRNLFLMFLGISLALLVSYCGNEKHPSAPSATVSNPDPWLGHNDSAHYVGINTCRQCHAGIYETFIKTGMGQSFDSASRQKSSAKFDKHTVIYDKENDFYYHPFWKGDKYYIKEFRLEKGDTVYSRTEQVNFIVGSGQHTNSHMFNTNGYLHQMPMTYYTQKGTWDLPPGFENGANSRFFRKIGLECMSCHNAYPDFVEGSENKYNRVMNGIDCERCHGPGSVHVALKQQGVLVDTSRYVDYSIVNPGKLPVERQFDVCMRCHLQGDAVLQPGKSFYDFRPGMVLSDFITVFMPKYKGAETEFIMASHAARLKMSKCFRNSLNPDVSDKSLRPYKEGLTCVTCHNPHVSVRVTGQSVFNNACLKCHNDKKSNPECSAPMSERRKANDNCVSCHMPRSGSIDIPHVSVHDHYIRKPVKRGEDVAALKTFIGLYAVNDDNPSPATKARGYVNYYEKFDMKKPALLDSALHFIPQKTQADIRTGLASLVQIYFMKRDLAGIVSLVNKAGRAWILDEGLKKKSWNNEDAWTAYRIGEAYFDLGNKQEAEAFYSRATSLAPFSLDFQSKLGITLLDLNKREESAKVFDFILSEDNKYASAYTNRGRIYFYAGNFEKADDYYNKALALDPDLVLTLKNKVDLYNEEKHYGQAKEMLLKILKKKPDDKDAKMLLQKMKDLKLIS
jgi:tetratricopeptide (TPR) repeat protein